MAHQFRSVLILLSFVCLSGAIAPPRVAHFRSALPNPLHQDSNTLQHATGPFDVKITRLDFAFKGGDNSSYSA